MINYPKHYVSKEISWLSFNARVLQEAADPEVPLIERIKFLGIFSSNLDEFYRVRVATLKRLTSLGKKAIRFIGSDPREILREIQSIALEQHKTFDQVYEEILMELADEKIFILNEKQLSPEQGEFVKAYFHREVRPKLIPIMIDQVPTLPDLRDQFIYLVVCLAKKNYPLKTRYALIEVPTDVLSRFLVLPQLKDNRYIILLDDVIRYSLVDIFSVFDFDDFEAYTIKLTRDAELDIDSDLTQSYIKKISRSLKKRKGGLPVRFIHDANLPQPVLKILTKKLKLGRTDTFIAGARYHNFKDFIKFPDFDQRHLRYRPTLPLPHPELQYKQSIMDTIEKKDILLHYPYQSFDYVIDLLREASIDPKVRSIKIVIYRAARDSSVINALINAARNGKKVFVILELQARFDEAANIYWANRLQDEKVKVIYGVPGLKVHSKICLISAKSNNRILNYAIIGTGNFNESTAKLYGDHSLFTMDRRLTGEIRRVFDFFESNYKTPKFKHLLVSPFNMRSEIVRLIRQEIKNRKKGKKACIFLKLNNLTDPEIVQELYKASQSGVELKLIIRSMFSLVPGVPSVSEDIEARSIVDQYLEHSRIFMFCNDNNWKYYISSADLMPRNLDHRVELTCPVYDKKIKEEIRTYMELQWSDNVKARILNEKMDNQFYRNDSDLEIRAQWAVYEYLKGRVSAEDADKIRTRFQNPDGIEVR